MLNHNFDRLISIHQIGLIIYISLIKLQKSIISQLLRLQFHQRVSKSYPFFFFFTCIIVLYFYYCDYESKNDGFEKENKNARRDVVSL
jgi:hypothetical protein